MGILEYKIELMNQLNNNQNLFYIVNNKSNQGLEGSIEKRRFGPNLLLCYPYDLENILKLNLENKFVSLYEIPISEQYKTIFKSIDDIIKVHIQFDKINKYFIIRDENDFKLYIRSN